MGDFEDIILAIGNRAQLFSFAHCVDKPKFEEAIVKLLAMSLDKKVGVNFISKSFDLYPLAVLVETVTYRLSRFHMVAFSNEAG